MGASSGASFSGDGYPVESSVSSPTPSTAGSTITPKHSSRSPSSRHCFSPPPAMTINNLARLKMASEVHWTLGRTRERLAQEAPLKLLESIKKSGNPELLKYSLTESTVLQEVLQYIGQVSTTLQLIIHDQTLPLSTIIEKIKDHYRLLYTLST